LPPTYNSLLCVLLPVSGRIRSVLCGEEHVSEPGYSKLSYVHVQVLAPNFWFSYFLRNKSGAWRSLSGVLLSITGAEALFADLGHFNRQSIQLGMLSIVYPALLLTYLGQAAYLTQHPENVSSWAVSSMRSCAAGKPLRLEQ